MKQSESVLARHGFKGMIVGGIAISILFSSWSVVASGLTTEQRLELLEKNFQMLQKQIAAQEGTIARQERVIADQRKALHHQSERLEETEQRTAEQKEGDGLGEWWRGVEMSAVVEVEAGYTDPYAGGHESDVVVATAEIGISAQVSDWVAGEITLLYEEDDTDLEIDVATITIANAEQTPLFFTAGQAYVPFGVYETGAVSDPLTLEIGEARETVAQVGFEYEGWTGSVFGFNGDVDRGGDDQIDGFGANLGFEVEFGEESGAAFGLSCINSLGDSDALQDILITMEPGSHTGCWEAFAALNLGAWTFMGEYLSAAEDFSAGTLGYNGHGTKPAAWNLELDYGFSMFGMPASFALAYQGTHEALGLELPERRYLVALSAEVYEHTTLSLEWAHDRDYSTGDMASVVDGDDADALPDVIGGTGKSADSITLQLALEF